MKNLKNDTTKFVVLFDLESFQGWVGCTVYQNQHKQFYVCKESNVQENAYAWIIVNKQTLIDYLCQKITMKQLFESSGQVYETERMIPTNLTPVKTSEIIHLHSLDYSYDDDCTEHWECIETWLKENS